jgi:hypothetical protein
MKRFLILIAVLSIFTGSLFATTFIGGGVGKYLGQEVDSSSMIDWVEGRITFGSMLTFDLGAALNPADFNPSHQLQFLTYLNLDIPISNLEIYAGFSPFLSFDFGQFDSESLKSVGLVHAGIALSFQKVRIYGEAVKFLYYSPFNLLPYTAIAGGVQIGF